MAGTFEIPPGVRADGSTTVWWVPTLTNPAQPTTAEINGATALNITCFLGADGIDPSFDAETFEVRRFCMKETQESEGTVKWTIDDIHYIWDPQNPESESSKAFTVMAEQLSGFFVIRYGKDMEDNPDAEVADRVYVYKTRLGTRTPDKPEQNSELYMRQTVRNVQRIAENVALAA